jgi:hypothetical protein
VHVILAVRGWTTASFSLVLNLKCAATCLTVTGARENGLLHAVSEFLSYISILNESTIDTAVRVGGL